jgi:predicted RNase H-like HicB family nuclease
MKRRYTVVFEWSGSNDSAYAPDVPGCVSTGKTLELIRCNMAAALAFHFRSMARDGDAIPQAATGVDQVERLDPSDPVETVEVAMPEGGATAA